MAGYIGGKVPVVTSGTERKQHYNITTTTTSLTGLQYTPTKVHVFHNGVRLVDGTDYTATTGTSITLTNAAENGDDVVVISYASFQTSDTVSAANGGTFAGNVTMSGTLGVTGNTTMSGDLNTTDVLPSTDNTSDLGSTAKRYQDLYLSGGLYVGGTGSANKLDDYEEGTWTPVLEGSSATGAWSAAGANGGYYVKVGKQVTAWMNVNGALSGASGTMEVSGLPFTSAPNNLSGANNATYSAGSIQYWNGASGMVNGPLTRPSNTRVYFHSYTTTSTAGGSPAVVNSTHNLHCFVTYYTA